MPTHCAFCGVQCGMFLRVSAGQVTGVEPRNFPHNEGHLYPKGVVAYQQVGHPDRLKWGRAQNALVMHARGIEHSTHGVDNCLACINLALARGMVGKLGSGAMMLTGQGNGQGGREVGQKANQLPGYRHIDVLEERQYVADVWGIPWVGNAW